MTFGFCQIALTALYVLSLGTHLAKHGEPKDGKYSFWTALVAVAIEFTLLYFGGFYG
jgi:hypothetical protein